MLRNRLQAGAMLAAGAVAGGVLAATLTASAADSGSSDTSPGTYAPPPPAGSAGPGGPGARTSTPMRGDESTPSDSIVATLTQRAEAKVAGGTVYRVETDA